MLFNILHVEIKGDPCIFFSLHTKDWKSVLNSGGAVKEGRGVISFGLGDFCNSTFHLQLPYVSPLDIPC